MSKNESFFPITRAENVEGKVTVFTEATGITLRDYFAAKAMAATISTCDGPCLGGLDGYELNNAKAAYKIADAMLKAREVGNE